MKISDQKLNGVVYTPKWIVDLILNKIDYKNNILDKKIIDPACGEGAFLIEAVERFIVDAKSKKLKKEAIIRHLENNIFGFDIDEENHRLIAISASDNLMKGAAGSAIQNMNVMCGFDEMDGLRYTPLTPV